MCTSALAPNLGEQCIVGGKTYIAFDCTIGAGCIIGSNLTIGRWAMVGMGAVVTRSIPDFHLVIGHPAKSIGAVCRCGNRICTFEGIPDTDAELLCTACGLRYHRHGENIVEMSL